MEEQERVFTALTFEDYEWSEYASAWSAHFSKELETRKYAQIFNIKIAKVYDWVYKHKDIVWDTTLEEQEKMMLADGVITPEDI